MSDPVEPVALPWLPPAADLEALAVTAQGAKWTEEQAWQAVNLWCGITHEMAVYVDPPPVVEPEPPVVEPPVDPPPVDPSPPVTPPVDPPIDPPSPPVETLPPVYPEPIPPVPPIVEPGAKLLRAKDPPPSTRPHLKAKPGTLMNIIRNQARPGDWIECDDVDFGAGYNFDKPFPSDQKVVITSKTPMGTNFTVPPRFTAPGYWLYKVRTSYDQGTGKDAFNVKLEANHINITKCWLQGPDGIASRAGAIAHCQINWNRFTGRNKTMNSRDSIYFWLPDAGAFLKPTDGPNNLSICYNFFDDPASPADEDHHIYFGATKASRNDMPMMENVFIDYNLWKKTSRRTRPLYMKRGCTIRRNTCESVERNFGIRHGQQSVVWANIAMCGFVHAGGAMTIGATPEHHHDWRGNEFPGSDINLFCGSGEGSEPQYQAASYALLAGNKAKGVLVGKRQHRNVVDAQGGKCKGVKVWLGGKMQRSDVKLLDQTGTVIADALPPDFYMPQTDRLTELRVGLETANQGAER